MTAIHAFDLPSRFAAAPSGRPGFPRCVAPPPRGASAHAVDALHAALLHDGALLMRGVDVDDASAFLALAESLGGPIVPASALARSDARFLFALCVSPRGSAAAATIVDGRRVLGELDEDRVGRLLDEPVRLHLRARDDRSLVRSAEWVTSAIRFHPITHEPAFGLRELAFADAATTERASVAVSYLDGTAIERGAIAHLREAVARHAWVHRWRRGDLLVIDRNLVLHDAGLLGGAAGIVVAESGARV